MWPANSLRSSLVEALWLEFFKQFLTTFTTASEQWNIHTTRYLIVETEAEV